MSDETSSFGTELRRQRVAAGLSLSGLAEATHYSKSHLSKVETGRKAPSGPLARACDTALGAGGRLTALVETSGRRAAPSSPEPPGHGGPWTATHGFPAASLPGAAAIGAQALLGTGLTGRGREPSLHSADTLRVYRTMFDHLRLLGQQTSPATVLPSVVAQTHALSLLAKNSGPELGTAALMLAARHAEYSGWMAQEAGDDPAALWWTDQAVEMATASGDGRLHAYALIRRACIAMYAHDGLTTIELGRRARAAATASPRVRAIAAEREAQGHALVGDYDSCRRALDHAATAAEEDTGEEEDAPVLGSSTVRNRLSVVTGWCMYDVGRPAEAAAVLEPALDQIPMGAVRARTRFGMRLALAHAGSGSIDRACDLAHGLLDGVDAIDSATVAHDVRQLSRTLARWHTDPAVRGLTPRLARALNRSPR
ncbi:helix-turn-helix domain-containing protein [Nocardiopsis ansamitocini]|uniref:HTH cro/C1-type domain-containing protein n=1 Tax=Nocardiopsis ansamitocini TaxID=1670832 RepID=A0A9W6P3P7_9ACTN|nr:helix-turn-helix transcriptional regulator [Nocardiopsis ansamitocini]GLU46527.1 hypothetical protein Nans01_08780 [Nocardiopsis ansamitocini]